MEIAAKALSELAKGAKKSSPKKNDESEVFWHKGRSRGGQSGHATHIKNAQVINVQRERLCLMRVTYDSI